MFLVTPNPNLDMILTMELFVTEILQEIKWDSETAATELLKMFLVFLIALPFCRHKHPHKDLG